MHGVKKTYEQICEEFSWDDVQASFDWNPAERFNIAHEICDRHAKRTDRIALFWLGKNGDEKKVTFAELKEYSNRFANVLLGLGVQKGDRVACLLPKIPELLITLLATLKMGAIYVPLFTAFGPNAIQHRVNHCRATALVTNPEYRINVDGIDLPHLKRIITVSGAAGEAIYKSDVNFWTEIDKADNVFQIHEGKLEDLSIIQYTSGSTGLPKGTMWSNQHMLTLYPFIKYGFDLQLTDVFWGSADPGWAYGLGACLLGPLLMGHAIIFSEHRFTPETCYHTLEKYKVNNFTLAPTAFRALMAAGDELRKKYEINLRAVSSVGEPLNPEVINWFRKNFGVGIYDGYGCSEMIMFICNFHATDMIIKTGSMGKPIPGCEVALLDHDGNQVPPGEMGLIAYNTEGQGTCFMGYWEEPEKTKERFIGKWFLPGDLAIQDANGYFWFQGRDDDIISCAGYRIGPFEIESALLEHMDVVEAAVVGVADALKGEAIKGYVVLRSGVAPSVELAEALRMFVKNKLAKHQTPKEIEFTTELPKTPSGKIRRASLRKGMAV
jgi:acetyl-CoA synthetase